MSTPLHARHHDHDPSRMTGTLTRQPHHKTTNIRFWSGRSIEKRYRWHPRCLLLARRVHRYPQLPREETRNSLTLAARGPPRDVSSLSRFILAAGRVFGASFPAQLATHGRGIVPHKIPGIVPGHASLRIGQEIRNRPTRKASPLRGPRRASPHTPGAACVAVMGRNVGACGIVPLQRKAQRLRALLQS